MKHRPEQYANALAALLAAAGSREEEKKILGNFLRIAVRNGDVRAARRALERTELLLAKRGNGDMVTVESARPLHEKDRVTITRAFPKTARVEERVNPSLVAGVRITINGERELDGTLASKLNRLFT